ncbi:hypothetical protein GCM10009693_21860 [Leucobacter chromiireducens subsp. chromiireducens]|uniref:DUF559 domain-containing protein n=2 Tax=Leucobacter TaxID=55968 RepID=A0ABS1SLJ7_9MICO|nr:DUF559 domain-containing protein [Leucobacter chromiireducens subsp. chromiireducens]
MDFSTGPDLTAFLRQAQRTLVGMRLHETLRRAGGILRASVLHDLGHSVHTLRAHVHAGQLVRPRHGWIALPSADPDLVHAAVHGVLLSCMTVIERESLWVPELLTRLHVAAPTPKSHVRPGEHVCHWGVPVVRRRPFQLMDRVENALVLASQCQSAEAAHAIWESALRSRVVTRDALARLPLRGPERALLAECTMFSESGYESYVLRRLRALRLHVVAQAWLLGARVDFLVEGWLVVQVDGGHHVGKQRDYDNVLDTRLAANGYATIRVSAHQIEHEWTEVQGRIMMAISQGRPATGAAVPARRRSSGAPSRQEKNGGAGASRGEHPRFEISPREGAVEAGRFTAEAVRGALRAG